MITGGGLRQATLRQITDAECAKAFKGRTPGTGETFDAARMRCAIDPDGREPLSSGCFGDSGGPLIAGTNAAPVQIGVVSWGGDKCGADHSPSVFADVERYRSFISDPDPTWAPTRKRAVKIKRSGSTLTCTVDGPREPGTHAWPMSGSGCRTGVSPRPSGPAAATGSPAPTPASALGCFVGGLQRRRQAPRGRGQRADRPLTLTPGVRPRIVGAGCPRSAGRSDATRCCARSGAAAWPSSTWRASPICERFVALKELRALHDDDPSLRAALPARGAAGRLADRPERRHGLRLLRARRHAVPGDGVPGARARCARSSAT